MINATPYTWTGWRSRTKGVHESAGKEESSKEEGREEEVVVWVAVWEAQPPVSRRVRAGEEASSPVRYGVGEGRRHSAAGN